METVIKTASSASHSVFMYRNGYVYKIWIEYSPWRYLNPGLAYETKVYEKINSTILREYPHAPFVRHVASGSCPWSKLEEELKLTSNQINRIKAGLISKLITRGITNDVRIIDSIFFTPLLKVNYNITENCTNCITYGNVLYQYLEYKETSLLVAAAFGLLVICYGITLLYQHGIVHNDLHHANIMIMDQAGVQIPRIFDYDLAYMNGIDNDKLDLHYERAGMANYLEEDYSTDLIKFIVYINLVHSIDQTLTFNRNIFGLLGLDDEWVYEFEGLFNIYDGFLRPLGSDISSMHNPVEMFELYHHVKIFAQVDKLDDMMNVMVNKLRSDNENELANAYNHVWQQIRTPVTQQTNSLDSEYKIDIVVDAHDKNYTITTVDNVDMSDYKIDIVIDDMNAQSDVDDISRSEYEYEKEQILHTINEFKFDDLEDLRRIKIPYRSTLDIMANNCIEEEICDYHNKKNIYPHQTDQTILIDHRKMKIYLS